MKPWIALCVLLVVGACGGPNAAQREQIGATQAVVDQKVRAGQMTEAEGRMVMAKLKADMDSERRRNAILMIGDGPAVYQPVGGGTYVRY